MRLVSSLFFRGNRPFHGKLSAVLFFLSTQVAIVVTAAAAAVVVVVVTDTALGGSIAADVIELWASQCSPLFSRIVDSSRLSWQSSGRANRIRARANNERYLVANLVRPFPVADITGNYVQVLGRSWINLGILLRSIRCKLRARTPVLSLFKEPVTPRDRSGRV
jgi:hypothetical protein